MPPGAHFGLKDQETRYRQRYLDLIVNPEVQVSACGTAGQWDERRPPPAVERAGADDGAALEGCAGGWRRGRVPSRPAAAAAAPLPQPTPPPPPPCAPSPDPQDIFRVRSKIIAGVRRFLDDRGFLEVRPGRRATQCGWLCWACDARLSGGRRFLEVGVMWLRTWGLQARCE